MPTTEPRRTAEDLVRQAIQQSNPYRHLVIPPPAVTPAQLRIEAEHEAGATWPWPGLVSGLISRRKLFIGGAATIGTVAAAYFFAPSAAIAAPGQLDIDFSAPVLPAADKLLQLANTLTADGTVAPADDVTTYVHLQRWSMDTIHPVAELLAQDIQIWWHQDRSGEEIITSLPAQQSGQRIAQYLDELPRDSHADPITYGPGVFSTLISTPSPNPVQLKAQLDQHEPPENGPQATLRAVADVAALHHLSIGQRIAFLVVLAGIPGLVFRGQTADRAGRNCLAFSMDSGDSATGLARDVLLVGTTGVVLGHEVTALTPPPRSPISENTIIEYALHLRTEHRPAK